MCLSAYVTYELYRIIGPVTLTLHFHLFRIFLNLFLKCSIRLVSI